MSIVRAFLDEERQKEMVVQAHIEAEQQAAQFEKERQQVLQNMRAMPGSSSNPILIEKDDDEDFPPLIPYQHRMSTIPTYQPTCEKCGQLGHEEPTCTTPLRMYVKCEYCAWLKESQRLCMHFDMSLGITRGNPWKVMGFSGVWPYLHNAVTNYLEIFITIGQYIWLWTHQFIKPYIKKCIQQKGKDIEKRTKIQNVGNVRFFLYLHLSVNSNLSFMTKKPKVSYSHTYCPAMLKFSRWLVTEL